jgi:hypothetical protein
MSETSKKARAAMKDKVKRLTTDRPLEKVDSSTWSPGPLINAQAKTGMRPVSRRQFKKGGKVLGEAAPKRADRVQRKAGGKTEMPEVDRFINRDVKKANEFRDGIKHIGGMKKGGVAHRKHRDEGGNVGDYDAGSHTGAGTVTQDKPQRRPSPPQGRRPQPSDLLDPDQVARAERGYKKGGRTEKMDGGSMNRANVPSALMNFSPTGSGSLSPMRALTGRKHGGKTKHHHDDEAADKALIKKMVKSEARTGHAKGGSTYGVAPIMRLLKTHSEGANSAKVYKNPDTGEHQVKFFKDGVHQKKADYFADDPSDANGTAQESLKRGFNAGGRSGRATGGGIFSGSSYPGKIPGAVPGGRTARSTGGNTRGKGKTDINIVINAEKGGGPGGMPPGMPTMPPKGLPIPMPPPGAGGPPGMPPGMPPMPPGMPPMPPGGMPPMPPDGMPPMPRKTGGRAYHSYKDMDAGSGGAKGREEKTEIAKRKGGIQKA